MDQQLRLRRGQQHLTLEQRAEAEHVAALCLQRYLSTEPVDEQEAEGYLWRAYEAVGLAAPRHVHWLDGPIELVSVLAHESGATFVQDDLKDHTAHCVWDDIARESREIDLLRNDMRRTVDYRVRSVVRRVRDSLPEGFGPSWGTGVAGGVWTTIGWPIQSRVVNMLGEGLWRAVGNDSGGNPLFYRMVDRTGSIQETAAWHSICAYSEAADLANAQFF